MILRVLRVLRGGCRGAMVVAVLVSSACGYSLSGRGSFLPESIKTIGIPLFANSTSVFEVERKFTERVSAEFIGRGKYTVLPQAAGADAVLIGVIRSITAQPSSLTDQQQASRYVITVTASIEFKDAKTDKVLWSNPALQLRDEYEVTTGTSALDPAAFFGQETNAVDRIANNFAKRVVTSILEAF